MSDLYPLPSAPELLYARAWLLQGAPSAARGYDPREAVRVLIMLINALPGHLPVYCHGTVENAASHRDGADPFERPCSRCSSYEARPVSKGVALCETCVSELLHDERRRLGKVAP